MNCVRFTGAKHNCEGCVSCQSVGVIVIASLSLWLSVATIYYDKKGYYTRALQILIKYMNMRALNANLYPEIACDCE